MYGRCLIQKGKGDKGLQSVLSHASSRMFSNVQDSGLEALLVWVLVNEAMDQRREGAGN